MNEETLILPINLDGETRNIKFTTVNKDGNLARSEKVCVGRFENGYIYYPISISAVKLSEGEVKSYGLPRRLVKQGTNTWAVSFRSTERVRNKWLTARHWNLEYKEGVTK